MTYEDKNKELFERIENNFTYHVPFGDQAERYVNIRSQGGDLARLFAQSCPPSRELSLALTQLEDAIMWANAAIARNEKDGSN